MEKQTLHLFSKCFTNITCHENNVRTIEGNTGKPSQSTSVTFVAGSRYLLLSSKKWTVDWHACPHHSPEGPTLYRCTYVITFVYS